MPMILPPPLAEKLAEPTYLALVSRPGLEQGRQRLLQYLAKGLPLKQQANAHTYPDCALWPAGPLWVLNPGPLRDH